MFNMKYRPSTTLSPYVEYITNEAYYNVSSVLRHCKRKFHATQPVCHRGNVKPTTSGQQRQLGVSEAFARGAKYQRGSNQWQALTDSVTRYLVEEMVPFRTVEKLAFKAMLQAFDKQYVLPDRKYFSQTAIPEKYLSVKEGIIQDLRDIDHSDYCSFILHNRQTARFVASSPR